MGAANVYVRGGIPRHVNGTTAGSSAVEEWTWPGGPANFLWFRNTGAAAITLSFTQADADNGIGIPVAASGVLELPAEIGGFYTASLTAQTFEAVAFVRRG